MEFINGEYSGYIYIGLVWLGLYLFAKIYSYFGTSDNGLSNRDNKKIRELYTNLDMPIEQLTAKSESLMSALERRYKDKAEALSYIQTHKKQVFGLIKSKVQQDDMLSDMDLMLSLITEATSASELKRKTDIQLIELERKYDGNAIAEDAFFGIIRDFISERMVELQKQEDEN